MAQVGIVPQRQNIELLASTINAPKALITKVMISPALNRPGSIAVTR
ncbi:hypothetical protein JCM19237_2991 [Photobacterium aphoticum]|uniref:Uncharacterized protein n=1 Tax=Photobacterium aphoticum TaxID=754436 RepID=A0A090QVV1_9GAMM|nr:hypothetical protein JCM19237_2991 [Photobacterium aphoticum]